MGKFVDLTGQRFGRLVVVSRKPNNKWRNSMWLCKCDCGKTTITSGVHLKNGHTQSWGNFQKLIKNSCQV